MTNLTPREIVSELDRFIVGQNDAKRAVAVALRSRWRRNQLDDDLRDEVFPKNILMIGPTGVGKTEISRRLAKLARAPFLKVEATKFTPTLRKVPALLCQALRKPFRKGALELHLLPRTRTGPSASSCLAQDALRDRGGKMPRIFIFNLRLALVVPAIDIGHLVYDMLFD